MNPWSGVGVRGVYKHCRMSGVLCNVVTLAEWLRRVIRNHMGDARVGSSPAGDAFFRE